MQWRHDSLTLDDDPARLDLDRVRSLLRQTYWAADRSRETIESSLRHSLNFGLYDPAQLIGFARVITDFATHAYLCDVVIDAEHRGGGLGTWLMECILNHPRLGTCRMDLFTKDAQGFYRGLGFAPHRFTCLVRYPENYSGGSGSDRC